MLHWLQTDTEWKITTGGLEVNEHKAAGVNNKNKVTQTCKTGPHVKLNAGDPSACYLLQKAVSMGWRVIFLTLINFLMPVVNNIHFQNVKQTVYNP